MVEKLAWRQHYIKKKRAFVIAASLPLDNDLRDRCWIYFSASRSILDADEKLLNDGKSRFLIARPGDPLHRLLTSDCTTYDMAPEDWDMVRRRVYHVCRIARGRIRIDMPRADFKIIARVFTQQYADALRVEALAREIAGDL